MHPLHGKHFSARYRHSDIAHYLKASRPISRTSILASALTPALALTTYPSSRSGPYPSSYPHPNSNPSPSPNPNPNQGDPQLLLLRGGRGGRVIPLHRQQPLQRQRERHPLSRHRHRHLSNLDHNTLTLTLT